MGQVTARFLQRRPTVQIEVFGGWVAVGRWVDMYRKTYPEESIEILSASDDHDGTSNVRYVIERKRNASTSMS